MVADCSGVRRVADCGLRRRAASRVDRRRVFEAERSSGQLVEQAARRLGVKR